VSKVENIKLALTGSVNELKTFDWNELSNPESIGVWPGPVKFVLAIVLFAAALGGGYWFHIKNLQTSLVNVGNEENTLRNDLETKAVLAANLEAYRAQMMEMEDSFGELLRQLPSRTEVPGLLEDITFTGLGSGLDFSSISPENEVAREFYIELPITISVSGSYHDFGAFVSGVASLDRIVTLHDFEISTTGENRNELRMDITARTYRYNAGEE
jgi:type IV pilus assembly protein PilO